MNKKIIVALVEGDTDEALLNTLIPETELDYKFQIYVVRCDLFSNYSTKSIKSRIGDFIKKEVLNKYKLKKSDIYSIIQMTDIDAIYLNDSKILLDQNSSDNIVYKLENIVVNTKEKRKLIIDRNKTKSSNINQVIKTKILQIDYLLFFCSCNLEHVVFDRLNVTQEEKDILIYDYIDDAKPEEVEDLLESVALQKRESNFQLSFEKSWHKMKNADTNIRNTNINLLKDYFLSLDEEVI